ncbi:MAG: HDOD domain-containing protein [Planctomycetes bacterium]|nr:HDOD domain-containing protein [Planctomycetota bacterium]
MDQPLSQQERIKKVVSHIIGLPTLPVMLANINRLMMNPRTSAKEVAQLISSDPTITSKILRVVNSSFYGFPSRITTITHAIVILGFNTIKSIILSSSIFDAFKGGTNEQRFNREEFWKHSIACGTAAKVVAKHAGLSALEEFFIAGLLHDVGKIIIDQHFHNEFMRILDIVDQKDCLMYKAEEEVLGVTHAELGAWLFEKWNLSKNFVESTSKHHNPVLATENPKYTAVIHLADIVVRSIQIGYPGDHKIPVINENAWKHLNFTPDMFPKLLSETDVEVEKALIFMDFAK